MYSNLFDAVINLDKSAVQALLPSVKNINARDQRGFSALIHAVYLDSTGEIVDLLLNAGADPNIEDKQHNTPLVVAIAHLYDFLSVLNDDLESSRGNLKLKDEKGLTPLQRVANYRSRLPIISSLLKAKAQVNFRGQHQLTPLMFAVSTEPISFVVNHLYRLGAKLEDLSSDEQASLTELIQHDPSVPIVKALLDADAKINAKDCAGSTPLHHAVMHEPCVEVIQLLLDAGADVNAKDYKGCTPLERALDSNLEMWIHHTKFPKYKQNPNFTENLPSNRALKLLVEHGASMDNQRLNNLLHTPGIFDEVEDEWEP